MAGERLIELMQAAALGAAEDRGMADVVFGQVTGTDPLLVKIDNRFELDEDFLIVPRSLTDYTVDLETSVESSATGNASGPESHSHSYEKYSALKTYTVKNALVPGDQVVMISAIGGQKYLIVDKLGGG